MPGRSSDAHVAALTGGAVIGQARPLAHHQHGHIAPRPPDGLVETDAIVAVDPHPGVVRTVAVGQRGR